MSKISVKSGDVSIEISKEASDIFDSVVKNAAPRTTKILESTTKDILFNARRYWPVRRSDSKDSRGKLYSEQTINGQFELSSIVGDRAPYAWAIKFGDNRIAGEKIAIGREIKRLRLAGLTKTRALAAALTKAEKGKLSIPADEKTESFVPYPI